MNIIAELLAIAAKETGRLAHRYIKGALEQRRRANRSAELAAVERRAECLRVEAERLAKTVRCESCGKGGK